MFTTPIHTNELSIERVLGAGLPVLLAFWRGANCPPCEKLNPALDSIAAAFAGKLLVAKVDAASEAKLVARFEITQVPSLVVVHNGQVIGRATGAIPEGNLRSWVDALLQGKHAQTPPAGESIALGGSAPRPASTHTASAGPAPATGKPQRGEHPVVLTDRNFDTILGQSDLPVLVDFWAPWCGPCRVVGPIVEQLAGEFAGKAVVGKLNVDENPRTSQRFDIRSIPALYIFRRGQVVERLRGAQPASVLRQALARHCAS